LAEELALGLASSGHPPLPQFPLQNFHTHISRLMGFMPASVLQLASWAGHAGWAATTFGADAFTTGALAVGLTGGLAGVGFLTSAGWAGACAKASVDAKQPHNIAATDSVKVDRKFFNAISRWFVKPPE